MIISWKHLRTLILRLTQTQFSIIVNYNCQQKSSRKVLTKNSRAVNEFAELQYPETELRTVSSLISNWIWCQDLIRRIAWPSWCKIAMNSVSMWNSKRECNGQWFYYCYNVKSLNSRDEWNWSWTQNVKYFFVILRNKSNGFC